MKASLSLTLLLLSVAILLLPSSTTSQAPQYHPTPTVSHSQRGWRFHSDSGRPLSCESYPRMCRDNEGPHARCCEGTCVDVKRDALNCGKCGRICSYGHACCAGRCASLMYDSKNCGECGNKCEHGSSCSYGMCDYA